MRKFYLFAALLAAGFTANAQFTDGFEDYPLGPYFGGHWSNWDGTSNNTNIIVSDVRASEGTKSGYIGSSPQQDAILDLGLRFDGVWTVQFDLFVDFGSTAYFNFQQDLTQLGVEGNWANEFYFGVNPVSSSQELGAAYVTSLGIAYPFTYEEEQWMTLRFEIDLDSGILTLYKNGEQVMLGTEDGTIPYGGDQYKMNGMDFFSYTDVSSNSYFIDNIHFVEGLMATQDMSAASVSVYPTLAKDIVNIQAKTNISNIAVFNTSGQQVMKQSPNSLNAQINVASLQAGTYVVKVQTGKEIFTKKIVVK